MIKVTKYLQLATFAMVKVSTKHFVLRVTFIRLMSQYTFLKALSLCENKKIVFSTSGVKIV